MHQIFSFLISAFTVSLLSLWEGFVFSKMWAWFVVPTFGLPLISIPVAIGLSLLVGFLTHQFQNDTSEDDPVGEAIKLFTHGFFNAGVVLLMSYILTFFL